jgi:tetratricopeptide (TPR) repeat protein
MNSLVLLPLLLFLQQPNPAPEKPAPKPEAISAFNTAIDAANSGRDDEAVAGFKRTLELEPGLYEAQLYLGQILLKLNQPSEAESWLAKAAAQREKEARPVYLLARSQLAQQKFPDAAANLAKASVLAPGDKEIALELAETLEKAGKKPEAITAYRQIAANPAARERLALLLLETGDPTSAAVELEELRKQSPTPAVLYALATAYLRAKQPDKSLPVASELVSKEPANAETRLFLGRLLRDTKQYDKAADQFYTATKIQPGSLEAWNELTGMLMLLENFPAALQTLEKAHSLSGDTPAYYWFRGTMLDALKDYKPALESYRKFLELSGGKNPDEEFKARQRARIIERILSKR